MDKLIHVFVHSMDKFQVYTDHTHCNELITS